mgnify:CR=1 FL=1
MIARGAPAPWRETAAFSAMETKGFGFAGLSPLALALLQALDPRTLREREE